MKTGTIRSVCIAILVASSASAPKADGLDTYVCNGLDPACYNDWGIRDPGSNGYRVLIYSGIGAGGNPHDNTPFAVEALTQLLTDDDIEVVSATAVEEMRSNDTLRTFDAIVFLNTQRDALDSLAQMALRLYVQGGGGFVGIHNAFGTQFNWDWYRGLLGNTQLYDHGPFQDGRAVVTNGEDVSTRDLPDSFEIADEWYFVWPNPLKAGNIMLLLELDNDSRTEGIVGFHGAPGVYENGPYPVSWCHYYDGGRAWLTTLGHSEKIFENEDFLTHVLGGIESAMGREPFCTGQ